MLIGTLLHLERKLKTCKPLIYISVPKYHLTKEYFWHSRMKWIWQCRLSKFSSLQIAAIVRILWTRDIQIILQAGCHPTNLISLLSLQDLFLLVLLVLSSHWWYFQTPTLLLSHSSITFLIFFFLIFSKELFFWLAISILISQFSRNKLGFQTEIAVTILSYSKMEVDEEVIEHCISHIKLENKPLILTHDITNTHI